MGRCCIGTDSQIVRRVMPAGSGPIPARSAPAQQASAEGGTPEYTAGRYFASAIYVTAKTPLGAGVKARWNERIQPHPTGQARPILLSWWIRWMPREDSNLN